MRVTLNGEVQEFPAGASLAHVLELLDVPRHAIAVEVNRTVVPRSRHGKAALNEGDVVEIVTFVGGG